MGLSPGQEAKITHATRFRLKKKRIHSSEMYECMQPSKWEEQLVKTPEGQSLPFSGLTSLLGVDSSCDSSLPFLLLEADFPSFSYHHPISTHLCGSRGAAHQVPHPLDHSDEQVTRTGPIRLLPWSYSGWSQGERLSSITLMAAIITPAGLTINTPKCQHCVVLSPLILMK